MQIDPRDNVAAVLSDIEPGVLLHFNGIELKITNKLRAKHKFALKALSVGTEVIMYGVPVGRAKEDILPGGLLGQHNVDHHKRDRIELKSVPYRWLPPQVRQWKHRTWMGYKRDDGCYGTRNIWLVIPLVFCENKNVDVMREALEEALGYDSKTAKRYELGPLVEGYQNGLSANELRSIGTRIATGSDKSQRLFANVDGIKFLNHQTGCGGTRSDADSFSELVAAYISHPNCAGATILSLGCQNAQMQSIQSRLNRRAPVYARKVVWLEQQQFNADQDFLQTAITETFIGLAEANKYQRSEAPISALTLGLECGGSDGFSGISANPVLGYVSDLINASGGKTILSEFPELSGVEQNLVDRCVNRSDAERFLALMHRYHEVVKASGSSFDANPSPGNIRDGLITGAMKSAGAARKGGSAPIADVLDYTEPALTEGLHLLCTPGNDVESTTALAGSGANLIAFTTGLGTPTGNPLAPVVKVSSNTPLALRMPGLIDFDAGPVVSGQSIEASAHELLELMIKIASGEFCKAEVLGQDDFIPWKRDISL